MSSLLRRFVDRGFLLRVIAGTFVTLCGTILSASAQTPPHPGCWRVSQAEYSRNPQGSFGNGYVATIKSQNANGNSLYYWYCPPRDLDFDGYNLAVFFIKGYGDLKWEEALTTGVETASGGVLGDPVGVGFSIGYGFRAWNNIIVEPFVSVDFPRITVNQTFPGGSYLGTKSNYDILAGLKIGPSLAPGLWAYGMGGGGVLNETLTINFIPLNSSINKTVPGGFLGAGIAYMPSVLQGFGRPVSLSLEYQHQWWASANYNTPAASPLFNYTFRRQDDEIKFGIKVYLNGPSARTTPALITK